MNLSRLKKSQLVQLCQEENLDTNGTVPVLKELLIKTGYHWDLRYVRTTGGSKKPHAYSDVEQVSDVELVSFEHWLLDIRTRIEDTEDLDDYLDPCLRDYFDKGVEARDIALFILEGAQ